MEYFLKILDLIIKSSIVIGLVFLIISYVRIRILEIKIEKRHKEHESFRKEWRNRTVTLPIMNGKIAHNKERLYFGLRPFN